MTRGAPHNERTEFFRVWHHVSAELATVGAALDRLPAPRRNQLLAIVHDLQAQQARLFHQVDQLPATSVAGIDFVERATEGLQALAERVAELARLAQPPPPAPIARAPPVRDWVHEQITHHNGQFGSTLDKLQTALHQAASEPIANAPAHYHPPAQMHAASGHNQHCGVCQQPVQVVYLPPVTAMPQGRQHHSPPRPAEIDEREDDAPRGKRRGRSARVATHEETPAGMVSTLLKGMGGVSVMIGAAIMVSNFSFADRFFGSASPPLPPAALERTAESTAPPVPSQTASAAQNQQDDKTFKARLEITPRSQIAEQRALQRAETAAAMPEVRSPATQVAPIARSRPAPPAAEVDIKPQRPPVKLIAKAPPAEIEPTSDEPPPSRKNTVMAAVAAPPPSAARPVEKPTEAPASADTGDGLFVAVLSTHKEAKAAREEFGELQKKHRDVLGAKQSEVQMTAGATGTWHRLVVTPALGKDAANELCNKLRNSGYGKCWVKPY